jgi:hypothetical protein
MQPWNFRLDALRRRKIKGAGVLGLWCVPFPVPAGWMASAHARFLAPAAPLFLRGAVRFEYLFRYVQA